MSTPNEFFLTDYGADPTGATPSDSAVTSLLAAMTTVIGGMFRIPAGTYKFANPIVLDRSMTVLGDGDRSTQLYSTSTSGDIITCEGTTASASSILIRGLYIGVHAGTTRTTGAISVNIKSSCIEFRMAECLIDQCATAVVNDCGSFAYFDDCIMYIEPLSGTGVGITSNTNLNGIYIRRCLLATVGLIQSDQCYMGINISQCGNALIEQTQCLGTGYGILADPSTNQICTSVWVNDSFMDHCLNGLSMLPVPGTNGYIIIIKLTGLWTCSSTYNGINLEGGTGGAPLIEAVTITQPVSSGNNQSAGAGCNIRVYNAHEVSVTDGFIGGNPDFIDIVVGGDSSGVIVAHNLVGYPAAPVGVNNAGITISKYGILVQDSATRVIVSENIVAPHTAIDTQNTSSGASVYMNENI